MACGGVAAAGYLVPCCMPKMAPTNHASHVPYLTDAVTYHGRALPPYSCPRAVAPLPLPMPPSCPSLPFPRLRSSAWTCARASRTTAKSWAGESLQRAAAAVPLESPPAATPQPLALDVAIHVVSRPRCQHKLARACTSSARAPNTQCTAPLLSPKPRPRIPIPTPTSVPTPAGRLSGTAPRPWRPACRRPRSSTTSSSRRVGEWRRTCAPPGRGSKGGGRIHLPCVAV